LALDFNKGTGTAGYRNSRIFIGRCLHRQDMLTLTLLNSFA
jgi:hypothetical protein